MNNVKFQIIDGFARIVKGATYVCTYVTGFAKTVLNDTRTEIRFTA